MIVKQRRQYEYALRSINVTLNDFLKYIQYEIDLDKLRNIRMRKLNFPPKKKAAIAKKSGVKRVHLVYRQALKKYSGNEELWLQYINLCLAHKSYKTLGYTFAQYIKTPNFTFQQI